MKIYHNIKSLVYLFLFTSLTLISCGGGGSDSNEDAKPSNDACSLIGLNNKIINGTSCANPEQSAIVRIVVRFDDQQFGNCTGTMITSNQVLTAGHCFDNAVSAGILIGDNSDNFRFISGVLVDIHPDYFNPGNSNNKNDLAIMKLAFAPNLQTLPIIVGRDLEKKEIVGIFGYGVDDSGEISKTLKSGEMKVKEVNNDFVIAEYNGEGSNVCFGDSGGPIVAKHNGQIGIFATTSFGTRDDCQAGDTTSFIKLQSQSALDFLNRIAPNSNFL